MKITYCFLLPALAAMLAISFSACQTTVNTVESANPKASQIRPEQMKHIQTDGSLKNSAAPIMLSTGKADDGQTLKVQLQLQNKTRSTAYVNYRVDWFDNQGMLVPGHVPSMQAISIEGGEIKSLSTIAPSPKAVDFRFILLEHKGN